MRILVIDDEVGLVTALKQLLTEQHYETDTAYDGVTGLDLARAGIYDLLVVDVMLPRMNGFDVVRTLREECDATPILLLTARGGEDDRVEGLDSGADDYLVKPFGIKELLARVRALTRRSGEIVGLQTLSVGDFALDLVHRVVRYKDSDVVLTPREFQMMELFMRNAGQVLSKETLFDRIWGYDTEVDSNVLEAYIYFLRKKLDASRKRFGESGAVSIQTVRGVGYVFKGN